MSGTCFHDPIGFITPEFVPLLMDKDLLLKIFVSLRGIKQKLYAKSFQVIQMFAGETCHVHVKVDHAGHVVKNMFFFGFTYNTILRRLYMLKESY